MKTRFLKIGFVLLFLFSVFYEVKASDCYRYHTRREISVKVEKGKVFLVNIIKDPNGISVVSYGKKLLEGVSPKDARFVSINGDYTIVADAYFYYVFPDSEVIFEKPVEAQDVEELIKVSREKGIHLNLYMDDKLYIEHETEEGEKYSESVEIPYYVKNFDEFIGKASTKALFIAENSILLELKKELEEKLPHINFVFSKPHYLECLNKEVNKGLAIKELLKKYGISPEETMAFGDQWNDLEMLKFVKYGYLMGNATEELKEKFSDDRITLSNDEDGIYEVIKGL